jgi:hypothetical protein
MADFIDPSGRCSDSARILELAASFGLRPPLPHEMAPARALAASRISDAVVTEEAFAAVQAVTGASLFVHREGEEVTGVLAFFFFNKAGLDAIEAGTFNPSQVDPALLAKPGETPVGAYAWGFAASTKLGGRAVVAASAALQNRLFWSIPVYTRAATADGERVLYGSLGYVRVPGDDRMLAVRPPHSAPPPLGRTN